MIRPCAAVDLPTLLAGTLDDDRAPALAPLPDDAREAARVRAVLASGAPLPADAALVVATSGSTGEPKAVVLSRRALRASALATHARLGGPGTWHCPLPLHYVAGAMTAVRAHVAGRGLRTWPSDLAGLRAAGSGPHYLSVVPTQLVRALDGPAAAALRGFDAILVGGAALTPAVLARAAAAGLRIVRTYGMSETCGGCVYDGIGLDGVVVDLGADGRISLDTPTAFSGYLGRDDLTRATLRGATTVVTQDRGRIAAGRLEVLGRIDDVVVTGGVNVDLAAVERCCERAWPGVALAVVGVADPEWGTRVVLGVEAPLGLAAARDRLRRDLEPPALPRQVVAGSLPRLGSGKVDRRALIARAEQEHDGYGR